MQERRRILGAKSPKAARYREERLGVASCRAAARVLGSRAGGEYAVQGCVEAIRRRLHCRAVAMGAGAACVAPLPRAPTVRHGEDSREKGIRTDRLGPAWQRDKVVWVGGRWAGWCVGPQGMVGCGLVNPREEIGEL
jgi:hypothetical protein